MELVDLKVLKITMKKLYILFIFSFFISVFSQQKLQSQSDFYFYENKGQIIDQNGNANSKVKYLFNSGGLNVQIKKEGFSYDVYEVEKTKKKKSKVENSLTAFDRKPKDEFDYKFKFHRVDIDFLNANKNPEIIAEGKSTDYENYYNIPHKPEGVTKVHRYQKITYKNIYPNIDLVFFKPKDTAKTIEYNFIIHPKGKISDIKLKFKGAKTKLKDGKLSMNLRFGEMQENIPHSWIEEPSKKTDLSVQFREMENGVFGFAAPQDSFDKTVVIDPVPTRIWGTYFGGDGDDMSYDFYEHNENIYTVGWTNSYNNISTSGAYQTTYIKNYAGFILKTKDNSSKLWCTYYNSDDTTRLFNCTVYKDMLYVAGISTQTYVVSNSYVLKFDLNGVFNNKKTFNIPTDNDVVALNLLSDNINNSLYIIGQTRNPTFLSNPIEKYNKNSDIFILNCDENYITNWSTYLGGSSNEGIKGAYLDENNNLNIFGYSDSTDLSLTNNAFQKSFLKSGNYYAKYDLKGNKLYCTFLGGNDDIEELGFARINNNILTYIGCNVFQLPYKKFIRKIDLNSNTQISFKDYPFISKITESNGYIDENENFYLVGEPNSGFSATSNAYNSAYGTVYLMKIDKNYQTVWSTYYGGSGSDFPYMKKNKDGFIYIFGRTSSTSTIASANAFQSNFYGGYGDVFMAKFYDCTDVKPFEKKDTICPNTNYQLFANGGDSYQWSGPNGFTSTNQNPIINNIQIIDSGVYKCIVKNNNDDCFTLFETTVIVEDKTPPIPDVTNLPDITGDCHTVISTTPTATDNCSGKITAITTDRLQYSIPGTYTITWKYYDGNGNTFSQTQKVIITSPALPTATSPQTFCAIDAPKISNISITGQNIIWYDNSGNVLNTATPLIDGTTYYASQTINGCESDKISIQVKVNATPLATGNANQDFCTSRNAQIKDLTVTGTSLKFYDNLGNLLPNSTLLQNNTSYFVTQTLNNCESPKLEIKVTLTANSLPANDYQLTFCNDTTANSKTEDLRKYQENIIIGSTAYSFEYFDQNNNPIADFANRNLIIGFNIFNVKVKSADGCWKMVQLKLQLNPKPVVNLPVNAEFCRGLSVNLDAGSGYKSYVWTKDGTPTPISNAQVLNVSEVGKYTVEVTNSSDCKNTSSTLVNQSILANILKVEITNNDAKVLLSANGDFVYSLDNSTWQNHPEFPNLNNGSYTIYVKTKLGCIIGEMNFTIFDIPNTFTPNSDGINDTWKITGMENYPNSEITILDRFGTAVLKKIINGTFEWNGQFNGRILPTGTYWYVLKVSDGRILQGYVLIKNRN